MGFDAFMSYSHAADGRLAPQVQAGLQRFAKPWWRRRALRVFRDETGLAASPQLWAGIEEALGASEWFVFLASPEPAGSEWVAREIGWWIEHRDPDRVLPVVTGGDLVWDQVSGCLDVAASSADGADGGGCRGGVGAVRGGGGGCLSCSAAHGRSFRSSR